MAEVRRRASDRRHDRRAIIYRPSISYSGCWTCRKRRVKCDERLPTCKSCANAGLACAGYNVELVWNVGNEAEKGGPRGRRRHISPDRSACNSMTDAEVSRSLKQIDDFVGASGEAVSGPFTVFDPEASHLPSEREAFANQLWTRNMVQNIEGSSSEHVEFVECADKALEEEAAVSGTRDIAAPEPFVGVSWTHLPHTIWIEDTATQSVFDDQPNVVGPSTSVESPESAEPQHVASPEMATVPLTPLHASQYGVEYHYLIRPDANARSMELSLASRLPPQLNSGFLSSSKRDTTAKMLIHHYASHMVHLMQPISHKANPFERIYLPLAIRGSSDLEQRQSPDALCSPRVAVCHGLLAAAAHNLEGLGSGEDMGAAAGYHQQKALITLRSALASRSSGYKDLMTAILALVSVDILNGGTHDHWVHLDAAMQLQASRHFANIVSAETRQLNTICTMLHLFTQTARHAPDPKPWSGPLELARGVGIDLLSPSVEYIYGISRATASALLKIYKLSQHLAYYGHAECPEELMQACEDLADDLCSWSVDTEEFTALGPEETTMSQIARAQAKAFHHAALIYYYRSIQHCSFEDLRLEQQAVLAALDEAEALKRTAPDHMATPAPIAWPAFIASCEAVGEERELWRDWWTRIQRYGMANYAKQQEVILSVWADTDNSDPSSDWREVLSKSGIRILPV